MSKKVKKKGKRRNGNPYIHFDCSFSTSIRLLFREKRLDLGLTYSSLAEIIDVHWSTVRKWEMGETKYCNLRHRPLIEDFLNGKLDNLLKNYQKEKMATNSTSRNLSPKIARVLEKIKSTYTLCSDDVALCEQFWKRLEALSITILKKLALQHF